MELLEDQILRYISEHVIAHPKDIRDKFANAYIALAKLQKENFIGKAPEKQQSVTLTKEGEEAARIGYQACMMKKQNQKNNENKQQRMAYLANICTIIAAVATILGIIISIMMAI